MKKLLLALAGVLIAVTLIVVLACSVFLPAQGISMASYAQTTEQAAYDSAARAEPAMVREVVVEKEVMAKAVAVEGPAGAPGPSSSSLDIPQRKIISTASLNLEVEDVPAAVQRVTAIAEDLGGFVEQLSSVGGEDRENANLTLRVPQDRFTAAIGRIEALGNVHSRDLGREDVSEEFIDLEARLKSLKREEVSLLSLLERAAGVSDVLAIERELSRVRLEIERHQGRLDFLERRVDLATIHVTLFPPPGRFPQPPSAILQVEHSQVATQVERVKNLVASHNGALDHVMLTTHQDEDRAEMTFRVFRQDFEAVLAALEAEGQVVFREVVEATFPPLAADNASKTPQTRIDVTFRTPEPGIPGWLLFAVLPIAVIVLLAGLAAAFYWTYQRGRRYRDRFVG